MKRTVAYLLMVLAVVSCARKQTGPVISQYSDIYKVGDQWYCPLCNQPVKNGDRSKIDPALYLSEWHDEFLDPNTFDKKMSHISDSELLASLSLPQDLSTSLASLAKEDKWPQVARQMKGYFASRPDNERLYHYDDAAKIPFLTIDEFRAEVRDDPERRQRIVEAGREVVQPDSGYTIGGFDFGPKVDFNHYWADRSEFGIHYCRFFTDMLTDYVATGDTLYARSFEDLFNQWYDQRDLVKHKMKPGEFKRRNVIWYELGLGNRIPRMIDSYRVYRDRLSPETHERMLKTILGSARWLQECLTRTPFHPYNWQTQTAMTLAYVALTFPEFKEAPQWLEASRKNMELHFNKDILDDGGYVERTGSYTNYVFGMFYRYMLMFKYLAADSSLLDTYLPRLEKLMEFTSLTMTPIGVNSPFNDCSRGTFLADLLLEMGNFFGRGDFIGSVAHAVPPAKLSALRVAPRTPERTSVNFEASKFAVLRDGWRPDSYFMMINYGPLENHGHYDILDFEIFANGVPIAVDAGIGLTGYSDPIHVSWYKQSRAHNMLTIDDAVVNKRGIAGKDVVWSPQALTDYFAATHDGYQEFHDTSCRRHFAFVKGQYWVVYDQVFTPHRNKTLDWNLHTPLHMNPIDNGFVSEELPGAAVLVAANEEVQPELHKKLGRADLRGVEGEEPNREVDWLILRKISQAQAKSDEFGVLLVPLKGQSEGETALPALTADETTFEKVDFAGTGVAGFRVKSGSLEDLVIFSDGKLHRFSDDLSGDFVFGWFRSLDGVPAELSVGLVSQIEWGEAASVKFEKRTDFEKSL